MPELPEVETICNNLRTGNANAPSIIGNTIRGGQVFWEGCVVKPSRDEYVQRVGGQIVREIGRRGKYLVFSLSKDLLLFHLGMSGDLFVELQTTPILPHYRLILDFDNGMRLAFNDPRKFGHTWLLEDPSEVLEALGPEPLDSNFTIQVLYDMLHQHHRQLKPLLMDQSFLAGLGNIYTDEALHKAHLHPLKLSNEVTREEAIHLWESIRSILQEGIIRNGSSIDWVYRGGDFQNFFRVYHRTGEPCLECGATIQRFVLGQRGTHVCPVCQPNPTDRDILII
jgi:formamidopyrimidine-DNA glycosylase